MRSASVVWSPGASASVLARTGQEAPVVFSARTIDVAWLIVFSLLAMVFALAISERIYVLNEGRTYFLHHGFADQIGPLQYWLLPQGMNTRFTSMYFADALSRTCGLDRFCTNSLESVLVAIQFLLFAVHGYQLLGRQPRALLVAGLWLLSSAALSGIVWQSIQHDKIAVIFILLTMILALEFFPRRTRPLASDVAMSVLLVPLLGVAFNAKEIAFYLPLGLTLVAIAFGLGSVRRLTRNAMVLAPAIAYAIFYIAYYYAHLQSSWSDHIAGGSFFAGLKTLLLLTLNMGGFLDVPNYADDNGLAAALYGIVAVVFVASGLAFCARLKATGAWRAREPSWLLVSFWRELYLLSLIIVFYGVFARTAYPSAFYIMVPTWAVLCLIVLTITRAEEALGYASRISWGLCAAFAAPFLIASSTNFREGGFVPRIVRASINLEATASTLRTLVPAGLVRELVLVVDPNADMDWYLLHGARGEDLDQDLPAYLFLDAGIAPTVRRETPAEAGDDRPEDGKVVVRMDRDYRLISLQSGAWHVRPLRPGAD